MSSPRFTVRQYDVLIEALTLLEGSLGDIEDDLQEENQDNEDWRSDQRWIDLEAKRLDIDDLIRWLAHRYPKTHKKWKESR